MWGDWITDDPNELTQAQKETIINQARLIAGIGAAFAGEDVNVAADMAAEAVENNAIHKINEKGHWIVCYEVFGLTCELRDGERYATDKEIAEHALNFVNNLTPAGRKSGKIQSTSSSSSTSKPANTATSENIVRISNIPDFKFENKQLGKKLGKHVSDFGGDPSKSEDRAMVVRIINDIALKPEMVVLGDFAGQGSNGSRGNVHFRIKGNDVVVTKTDGTFVTILKNGINNTSVKKALGK
ncbi:VENN motif pre-toxin domain-containing protein [Moraxella bovoculi]|uniref:VENN motif pre-toxin domain-containing protein n=1 Tax=Moraxella bovoculi TaxID=386891 RepID=UPI003F4F7E2B